MTRNAPKTMLLVLLGGLCYACEPEFTQIVAPEELEQTERGSFATSGRFFVIGVRPDGRPDAGGWIVEMTKSPNGSYVATNLVAATLEGTADGTLSGAPRGAPCFFSGMKAQGEVLYASCVGLDADRAALLQVDLAARTVRAGYFTSCNFEPATTDCQFSLLYPNGMAIDDKGRVYVSDTTAHLGELVGAEASHTLTQISVDPQASKGASLAFRHRAWFGTDIFSDGFVPNGIQIQGDILYYAAGSNINKLRILEDGSAGEFRVHYTGPVEVVIDDFAIRDDGEIVIAEALLPALVGLSASPFQGMAQEIGSYDMPIETIPSSVSFQPAAPSGGRVFPADSLVLTSYYGGGVQVMRSSVVLH